jgi:sugar phosphate isomerase/epimerase
MQRRAFIKVATGAVLGRVLTGVAGRGAAAEPAASLTLACRDSHLKATGLPDTWSALKELGLSGVEVAVDEALSCPGLYHPTRRYRVATEEDRQVLRDDLQASGQVITAFCLANRLDERLEQEIAWVRRLLPAAEKLNVKVIRIDVVPRAVSRDAFLPFAIRACKRLCELVEDGSVRYGIENHGDTTNDPAFLERLFDGVGSSRLGLTLDPCNFYWYGHPLDSLYAIYARFAGRTFHTHCKNIRYPADQREVRRPIGWQYDRYSCPLDEGDIDYGKVVRILRGAAYGGDLCVENECLGKFPAAEQGTILKRDVAALRQAGERA